MAALKGKSVMKRGIQYAELITDERF